MDMNNKNTRYWSAGSLHAASTPSTAIAEGAWRTGCWQCGSTAANFFATVVQRNAVYRLMGLYVQVMVRGEERLAKRSLRMLIREMRTIIFAVFGLTLASVVETSSPLAQVSDDTCLENFPSSTNNGNAELGAISKNGETALHVAVVLGNQKAVKCLIDKGVNLLAADKYGYTPLHYAARAGNSDIVKVLVNNMIVNENNQGEVIFGVQAVDRFGATPLHYAAWANNVELTGYLIAHGADINAKDYTGETPLHFAAENDANEAIRKLLEMGADIMARDYVQETPLHDAAWAAAGNAVRELINDRDEEEIAELIRAEDLDGDTPCVYYGPIREYCK